MALKFFSQKDIDNLTPETVSEDFLRYFNGLSEERRAGILEARPDLTEALTGKKNNGVDETDGKFFDYEDIYASDDEDSGLFEPEINEAVGNEKEEAKLLFPTELEENYYENTDLLAIDGTALEPVIALSVPDDNTKCILHRKKLTKLQLKYRSVGGSTFGMYVYYCDQCKRLFVDASKSVFQDNKLTEFGVKHTFWDLSTTNSFLRSKMEPDDITDVETIYIPDVWVDTKPTCPIHDIELDEVECVRRYKDREINLKLHICDKCSKYMVRRAGIPSILDSCAENGIPEPEFKSIRQEKPKKMKVPPKEVRPDFYINAGKAVRYEYAHNTDCYKLSEEDTLVVSDTCYCDIEDHETESVLALIAVNTKRKGKLHYLMEAGYCSECQKYYAEERDYKVLYDAGRPEVNVLYNVGEADYHITSGEVFELEKEHLDVLEKDIESSISAIMNMPDYVNIYETGDYDDGNLSFQKNQSEYRYGKRLDELSSYKPKPYSYRVDITFAGENETYYLGPIDVILEDNKRVISFNNEFGKKLVNYRTVNLFKDGKQYSIKLSRQFEIEQAQLFSYINLRTDEDYIFRSGITDPFLIRVLNLRKQQHNLVDIIATIQENQNVIVDEHLSKNLIIQGCAGSGKTMVLLHRLSSLKYTHQDFAWDRALILTPNSHFNTHIGGLAEGLQIGSVGRMTVEGYYLSLLMEYSKAFKPENKISSEMSIKQIFVNYVYSDSFISDFESAYKTVVQSYLDILYDLADIYTEIGFERPETHENVAADYLIRITEQIKRLRSLFDKNIGSIREAQKNLDAAVSRKTELEKKIPNSKEYYSSIVSEAVGRANKKLLSQIEAKEKKIEDLNRVIIETREEKEKYVNGLVVFGRNAKIAGAEKRIVNREQEIAGLNAQIEECKGKIIETNTEKTDDEYLAAMKPLILYDASIRDEIALCTRLREGYEILEAEYSGIDDTIKQKQEEYLVKLKTKYPDAMEERLQEIEGKMADKSDYDIYRETFDKAVAVFTEKNEVKNYSGVHRYDLYAELIFAEKYYGRVVGDSSFIFIDEGQDISINEYRLIRRQNAEAILNVFGDVNQLIKPGRGMDSWKNLCDEMQAQEHFLNENYRNTNQITRFCNDSFNMSVMQTGVDGPKVKEINRKDFEEELCSLNIGSKRVAILLPRRVQKKKYLDETLLNFSVMEIIGDTIDNGRIALMYVDEVKGIEFDKVYVVPNKMAENEKYIAYTRALTELTIVIDDALEKTSKQTTV